MPRTPRTFGQLRHSWRPFGLGSVKPAHFREMLRIAWQNRDQLPYAWRILSRGVCDGCALGTTGLSDWTIEGTHLCLVRLNLLRLNTMGALDVELLGDVAALRARAGDSKALRDLGRLPYPMRRRRGEPGFTRVGWDELWRDVGARWRSSDPGRTGMYVTSRGVTNEVYYVAQKVMRYLGSNNVDNSARLCHSASSVALKSTLGVAATTCSYKDWYDADLIVFLGSNPANDQPVALKYLHEARLRGTRVVMVNAYREPGMQRYWVPSTPSSALFGTELTDLNVLVRVGGDLSFLSAAAKMLIRRGAVKRDFVEEATTGYAALESSLEAMRLEDLLADAGVSHEDLAVFVDELVQAENAVLVWSMGLTQHAHGADTVRAVVNLGLLREYVGRPGNGLMPIRGHSGVQGGAEMGAYATAFPGGREIDAASAAELSELWGFEVPASPGLPTVELLEAAGRGELDALYCIGGNFLETLPEHERVERALGRVALRVHSDIVLTSQMLVEPADVCYLLPARTRYEQEGGGTQTTTERRVVFSPEIPGRRIGEARSEWRLLLELARAVKPEGYARVHFEDAAAIRAEIERAVPSYRGIADLAAQGDQFQWGGPRLCEDRTFPTADGKARFALVDPPVRAVLEPDEFLLATRRGKQFNSMVQSSNDALTGADRDHVFLSPTDAARLGITSDEPILLTSATGCFRGRAFVAEVADGTLQGHWPEVNVLLPSGLIDPEGGVPDYNARVRLRKG